MHHHYILTAIVIGMVGGCGGPDYPGPLSPQESMSTFQLEPGFRIELFAAEPHVVDPVDVEFDEFGNIYAVEMLDYPYKPEPGKARSRIKYLEDTDGDGLIDHSVIFQDSLNEATSVLPWKGGLLVCSAPNILYLKDTDGDHKSDLRQVLFTGFFANNSEAQITNLKFNVDNWIYGSNHGNPGQIQYVPKPELGEISIKGTDFRFRLDLEQFEPASGYTQFGQAIDHWGQRFGTQNTIHLSQIVIPWRYLVRNDPEFQKAPIQNISDHDLEMFQLTPAPYWRAERTARRQKRYDEENLDRVEYADDHFTGCSGGTFYNSHLFPETYRGSIFTGEVAGNLIHRDVLKNGQGPLMIAGRAQSDKDREFLASTDSWFRPANLEVAPDGSLLVTDMYRQHIETPLSIPEDLKEDMDFYRGDDMGRIYRIVPVEETMELPDKFPGQMTIKELVALLDHPDGWWRLTAQRLLVEKGNSAVLEDLKLMFGESESPIARLHALFTMEALGGMTMEIAQAAINDSHPQIRIRGLQFSEGYPELLPQVLKLAQDPNTQVVFQAALTLGTFEGVEPRKALKMLEGSYGDDPWFRKAMDSAMEDINIAQLTTKN
jgi:putative membrane-bound dehydrogenase-like protein